MMKNFISEEMFAYVDETGSLNDNDPQSDFYVCTAIFVRESQREKLKTELGKYIQIWFVLLIVKIVCSCV